MLLTLGTMDRRQTTFEGSTRGSTVLTVNTNIYIPTLQKMSIQALRDSVTETTLVSAFIFVDRLPNIPLKRLWLG